MSPTLSKNRPRIGHHSGAKRRRTTTDSYEVSEDNSYQRKQTEFTFHNKRKDTGIITKQTLIRSNDSRIQAIEEVESEDQSEQVYRVGGPHSISSYESGANKGDGIKRKQSGTVLLQQNLYSEIYEEEFNEEDIEVMNINSKLKLIDYRL